MKSNPYQSPAAEPAPQAEARSPRRQLLLFGLYAGGMLGGTFGALGLMAGSLLAAAFVPAYVSLTSATIVGGFVTSVFAGGAIGPPLALALRERPSQSSFGSLAVLAAVLLGLANAACGIALLPSLPAIVLAGAVGALGGVMLVRRLRRFAQFLAKNQPSERLTQKLGDIDVPR